MKKTLTLTALILIICGSNLANAKDLSVNLKESEISWIGRKVTGEHQGKILLKEVQSYGTLKDPKGTFIVDMNSISVQELEGEWKEKFLSHIKSADFFEVEKYPTAKLVIKKVQNQVASGTLTIKDKTQEVSFPVKTEGKVFRGTLKFDRTKFNMIYGSGNFFKNLGDKAINNEVELKFKIVTE